MALKIGCCGFAEGRTSYYRHFPAAESPYRCPGKRRIAPVKAEGVQNLVLVKNEPEGGVREVICQVMYISLRGR